MKLSRLHSLALPTAALAFLTSAAQADLLYYGGFDEAAGVGTPTDWTEGDHQGVYLGNGVTTGSLTYPNLAVSGNKWNLDDPRGNATVVFTDSPLQAGETLFFSFLLQVNDVGGLTSSPSGIMKLYPQGAAGHEVVASLGFGRQAEDAADEFHISFDGDHRGFSHTDTAAISPAVNVGETLMIVGSYARVGGGGNVNFWLNPDSSTFGELVAPVAHYSDNGNTGRAVNSFVIASTSSGALFGDYDLDEFRFGTTWADVTPVPEPSTYALLAGCGVICFAIMRRRKRTS